jgi:putative addiction module component (TIGR02574 family)
MSKVVNDGDLLKLSARRRIEVISLLWNSLIDEGVATPPDDAALDEAESRIAELQAHPERGISLEEMRKRRGWKT